MLFSSRRNISIIHLAFQFLGASMSKESSSEDHSGGTGSQMTLDFKIRFEDLTFDKSKPLGEGGYGTVYLGEWKFNPVAIKQYTAQDFTDDIKEEIRKEAVIMAKVSTQSDYLVRFKGMILEKPHYSLVMEYMPGGDLYHLLHSQQEISWTVRYRIALDMAIGVHHLHENNVLHRDLKSLNVLLYGEYRAKLGDFGMSTLKMNSSSTSTGGFKGTALWSAPELFQRGAKATVASDIYSLGMILWELVSRKIPFADAASAVIAATWVSQGQQEIIPVSAPSEFKTLITDCWQKDPVKRPNASEVAKRLDSLWQTELKKAPASPMTPTATPVLPQPQSYSYGPMSGQPLSPLPPTTSVTAPSVYTLPSKTKLMDGSLSELHEEEKKSASPTSLVLTDKEMPGEADFKKASIHYMAGECSKAIPYLEKSIQSDYPAAYFIMGNLYRLGLGVTKNVPEAERYFQIVKKHMKWFKHQAETGDAASQHRLGRIYTLIEKDDQQAAVYYGKAALQGYVSSLNSLGVAYKEGKGVDKNEIKAVIFFKAAIDQGSVDAKPNKDTIDLGSVAAAKLNLGSCYEDGIGVLKDAKEAIIYYQEAAEWGYAPAQENLGRCYEFGIGVIKDVRIAFLWYKLAAEQGESSAQCAVGNCYRNEIGIQKDLHQAFIWYQKAARQEDPEGQYKLAHCYHYGIGIKKDVNKAFLGYQKAAEQKYSLAQSCLGDCYRDGIGTEKDEKQALDSYLIAAQQGEPDAQCQVGDHYINGKSIEPSNERAVYWFRKAAEQKHDHAQYCLGFCYENGKGVERDLTKAAYWYKLAAAQGHASAERSLAILAIDNPSFAISKNSSSTFGKSSPPPPVIPEPPKPSGGCCIS